MYDLCVCDRSSEGSGFSRVCDGKMPASEIGVQKILYRWCFLVGVATSPRQNSLGLSVLLPRSIMIPLLWEERGRESGRSSGVLLLSAWGESSPTLPPTTIRQGPTYGDDSISSVCTQVDSWTRESSTRTSSKYLKSVPSPKMCCISLSKGGVCVCLAIPSHSGQKVHMTETAVRLSMRGESLEPVENTRMPPGHRWCKIKSVQHVWQMAASKEMKLNFSFRDGPSTWPWRQCKRAWFDWLCQE